MVPYSNSRLSLPYTPAATSPLVFFNAYGNPARKDSVDYIIHLEDYVYEYKKGGVVENGALRVAQQCKTIRRTILQLESMSSHMRMWKIYKSITIIWRLAANIDAMAMNYKMYNSSGELDQSSSFLCQLPAMNQSLNTAISLFQSPTRFP